MPKIHTSAHLSRTQTQLGEQRPCPPNAGQPCQLIPMHRLLVTLLTLSKHTLHQRCSRNKVGALRRLQVHSLEPSSNPPSSTRQATPLDPTDLLPLAKARSLMLHRDIHQHEPRLDIHLGPIHNAALCHRISNLRRCTRQTVVCRSSRRHLPHRVGRAIRMCLRLISIKVMQLQETAVRLAVRPQVSCRPSIHFRPRGLLAPTMDHLI